MHRSENINMYTYLVSRLIIRITELEETKEKKMRLDRKKIYLIILILTEVDRSEKIHKCFNDIVM